jgi:hypothetical protein
VSWERPNDEEGEAPVSYSFGVFVKEVREKEFKMVYQTRDDDFTFRYRVRVHLVYMSQPFSPGSRAHITNHYRDALLRPSLVTATALQHLTLS